MRGPPGPPGPAGAAIGALVWRLNQAAGNTANNFAWLTAGTPDTSEHKSAQVIAASGTFTKLYVTTFVVLGSSNTLTITLRKNGVDTALAVTLAAGATSASLTGGSVSVVAGDVLTLKVVQSGTGIATSWGFCCVVSP